MPQLTTGYAIELDRSLCTCEEILRDALAIATRAENDWQTNGDGTVPTLWTQAQRDAFADILARTILVRTMLRARLLELPE